jgi:hypothetical protein
VRVAQGPELLSASTNPADHITVKITYTTRRDMTPASNQN